MKLYMVYGNAYGDSYGEYIHCFGIYTSKDTADLNAEIEKQRLIEKTINKPHGYMPGDEDNIWVEVKEIDADSRYDICLGGYAE